ncbi:ComF family protein [Hydrogenophaga sp.]|uniref:ComF family protein n=1 Tax=Hydrogenophaga sp. TaxID=1904254 RepID=UPI00272FF1D1|nr:phosphoribosyltransferase family protein [Hydrogenophaga sp.]MDP1684876.1 phosphoribosyltransferase family protein [Hydrogenophaga sp.]
MFDARRAFVESLPATCQVCAAWPAQPVCEACIQRYAQPRARCRSCASVLPGEPGLCGACLTRAGAPAVGHCVAAVDYAYPWDGLIARFKFRSEPGWAKPFAQRLLQVPQTLPLLQTQPLVVPIPLTAVRLGERGYNQAWELVKALRTQCRRHPTTPPCETLATALVRLGETPDQHSLGRDARLRNLRGVFAAHPSHAHQLSGRHVLLVDDVTTTGATLHTAAQALLQAGAARVSALVFARTAPSR